MWLVHTYLWLVFSMNSIFSSISHSHPCLNIATPSTPFVCFHITYVLSFLPSLRPLFSLTMISFLLPDRYRNSKINNLKMQIGASEKGYPVFDFLRLSYLIQYNFFYFHSFSYKFCFSSQLNKSLLYACAAFYCLLICWWICRLIPFTRNCE